MERISLLTVTIYLALCTLFDVKKKEIPIWLLAAGIVAGISCAGIEIYGKNRQVYDWALSIMPGILMLLCSRILKEKLGAADGWMVVAQGMFLNLSGILFMVTGACFAAAVCIGIRSFVKKCRQEEITLPFAPFLFLFQLLYCFLV